MTMIAAGRFIDGGVMLADSRATWSNTSEEEDRVQKIVSLNDKIVIGYAGDVPLVNLILTKISEQIKNKPKLNFPSELLRSFPRMARYHHSHFDIRLGAYFIIGAITEKNTVEFWTLKSPSYEPEQLRDVDVIGSGQPIREALIKKMDHYHSLKTIKERADAFLMDAQSALGLQSDQIEGVGGLLQVLLLEPHGIRPLNHGFMDLNPHREPKAMHMEFSAGKWVQRNLTSNQSTPLILPSQLRTANTKDGHVYDFEGPSDERNWQLNYFLTCMAYRQDHINSEFQGVFTALACSGYPARFEFLVPFGFWGSAGTYPLKFILHKEDKSVVLCEDTVTVEAPLLPIERYAKLEIELSQPGEVFLECYIDSQLLARRALYFGETIKDKLPPEISELEFAQRQTDMLNQKQRQSTDPLLIREDQSALAYFVLCEEIISQESHIEFKGESFIFYWENYPLPLHCTFVTALRLPIGEHKLRLDLVDAATRESWEMGNLTHESKSTFTISAASHTATFTIPRPGVYFVNLHVNDVLTGSLVLVAETSRPRYSYSLSPQDRQHIINGELFRLAKRAEKSPAS
ncbi:MAG TPA: hypothetical protein VLE93_00895 [Candidatus Saccharimonadales bacterium]|nr:hypothetical protein [Candidatus Saccharimonadales bacterium]